MRYDFGKVYKEIRKSKNLTQSDVCGNVLSPTTLSKIEWTCRSKVWEHGFFTSTN